MTMQSADQTEKVLVEEEKDVTITAGETVPVVIDVLSAIHGTSPGRAGSGILH